MRALISRTTIVPRRRTAAAVAAVTILSALIGTTARADASCTLCSVIVGAAAVVFGAYDPSAGGGMTTTGTIPLTPTGVAGGTIPVVVSLSTGSGTFATRTMKFGTSALNYNLRVTPAGAIFGDGTTGTATYATTLTTTVVPAPFNVPVYGTIGARQVILPGAYSDTITVTVSF